MAVFLNKSELSSCFVKCYFKGIICTGDVFQNLNWKFMVVQKGEKGKLLAFQSTCLQILPKNSNSFMIVQKGEKGTDRSAKGSNSRG